MLQDDYYVDGELVRYALAEEVKVVEQAGEVSAHLAGG